MFDNLIKSMGIDPAKLQSDFATFVEVAKDVQARLIRIEAKLNEKDAASSETTLQGN